jgi:hypothetical protein
MDYVVLAERRGIKQGIRIGSALIILRQLERRFGSLDEVVWAFIRSRELEQLEELSEALLDFAAPSDLENWLRQQGFRDRRKESINEITLRWTRQRFGALNEMTQAHIRAMAFEEHREFVIALPDFASRSDLENWLSQHPLSSTLPGAGEAGNGATIES